MSITSSQLISLFPQSKNVAVQYTDLMNELLPKHGITTPERIVGFVTQLGHESGGFTKLVENLNYSAQGLANTWDKRYSTGKKHMVDGKKVWEPNTLALSLHRRPEAIANNVYASRLGNGNEQSGDGWKYRGRGLIMITGAYNYGVAGKALKLDLMNKPELLEVPRHALIASLDYWTRNGLNAIADKRDVEELSKKINGGTIGLKERIVLWDKAIKLFAA